MKKSRILKIFGISAFGIAPIVLSSCSSYTTLVARTVSKGDGTKLDSNLSLSGYSEASLKSDSGMKAYIKEISENLIYDWLKRLSDTSNNVTLSNDFKNEKITINDDYSDLVDQYKSKYGSDSWKLKFQQEVLDPAGGTEKSYKQAKWNDWVTSQFETQLFNKSYLTYKDSSGKLVNQDNLENSTVSDLYNALQKENFVFSSTETPNGNALTNEKIDNLYADFMQYIWNQYVQIDTPYIVNMVLWKYGTPSQGLGNYYTNATNSTTSSDSSSGSGDSSSSSSTSTTTNSAISKVSTSRHDDSSSSDSSGSGDSSSSTTTATAGSYIYPYFSNDAVGSTSGSLTKYVNFITGANNASEKEINVTNIGSNTNSKADGNNKKQNIPYLSSFDSNGYGLTDIPSTLTDDSSTYILAKNASIYSDLYIEFAAASSYLFWRNGNITDNNANLTYSNSSTAASNSTGYGIPSIDTNIKHDIWSGSNSQSKDVSSSSSTLPTINGDSTTGLDPITSNFLSASDIFSSGHQYELKLDKSYVNAILKENGALNSLRNQDLYVIDSFIPSNFNLSNYIFLRDSAGVHAITIDGYNYINGTTEIGKSNLTISEKKKRAGQVVLFRSLYNNLNSKPSDYSFSVDVQSELKTFYENNTDWLIYSYAKSKADSSTSGSNIKLFDLGNLGLSDNEKNLATAINNYLHETANYTKVDDYNDALYKAKATYSANYGVLATSNGLAAPWTYATFSKNDSTTYDSNPTISFQIAAASGVVLNPFSSTISTTTDTKTYNYDGTEFVSQSSLYTSITSLTNSLNVLENSSFDGFKYSQYIYSDSSYVNAALLSFSSEGTDLADLAKIAYLRNYIGSSSSIGKFDFSTFKFSEVKINNTDISTYLNYAMSNFFFNSTFDSATNKWGKLSYDDNDKWNKKINTSNTAQSSDSSSTSTDTNLTKIVQDYKIKLWKNANQVYTSTVIDNYLSLYTTVASIFYMLENNSSYFLTCLTSQINVGDSAYIAWESSQNTQIQKTQKNANNLLSSNTLNRNINNSFVSSYIGGNNLYNSNSSSSVSPKEETATNNTPLTISYYNDLPNSSWSSKLGPNLGEKSLYQDSNDAKTYYTISGGKVGFLGLQTSGSNSLNSVVSNLLFTNPTVDNDKGLLYGYESLDNLKAVVQGCSSLTEINNIAKTLGTNLNQKQITTISNDTKLTLAEKKEKLLTVINNLSNATSDSASNTTSSYFTARNGIVNSGKTSEFNNQGLLTSSTSLTTQYASYVIQLNRSNLKDQETLLSSISKGLNSSTQTSKDSSYDNNTYDVFSNLLIQQAVNTTNQSNILSLIINKQGKIKAYDVRLYTGLGVQWIADWKVTNPTSSSSSSSDSSSSS